MSEPEIQELDPQTVERIAAGEVVERPASVVKELVENSLDADAERVTVAVESGGTDAIRVSDDGVGMSEPEVKRAVEQHTTSKIRDIDDLESGVATLGFRGEALHAIGAVSRVTITTRPRDGSRGTELTVEGGEITDVSPAGCPEGTTVEVRDLFYNVPARRKYLKQESTEFAHVNTVSTNYALANPDIAVALEHDGRETFATTGTGDLRETVLSVYGREVAESMRGVEGEDLPEGPLRSVEGLVSHPETNRAGREYLSTFVNGRYVTADVVRNAIVEAYGNQLAPDRFPFAVLFLEVDPATVDVNVHPRKLEIRFADESGVRQQVRTAIEDALLREGLVRTSAPRGRSAPEQAEIQPGVADDTDQDADTGERTATSGSVDESSTGEPAPTSETAGGERAGSASGSDSPGRTHEPTGSSVESELTTTDSASDSPAKPDAGVEPDGDSNESGGGDGTSGRSAGRQSGDRSGAGRKFQESGTQRRLGDVDADVEFDRLPAMRVLGQLHDTYVVAETADGMVLIDQHAADERINYERLRESFAGETTTQALADPVEVELTPREVELFDAHSDALARLGFHATLVDDDTVEVRTVPAMVAEAAGPELIRDALSEFVGGSESASETVEAAAEELLADLACYPSITGNTALTEGSVVDLLDRLDGCENPYACPHGRPVIVEFDGDELEARFERDYPGHR